MCVSVCVCVCVLAGWGGGGGGGVYVSPLSATASLSDTLSVKDVNQSLRACVCESYSFLYCRLELVRDLRVF